jgi:FtsP/CotA-like multicopper oxidase with cupredoxin domain
MDGVPGVTQPPIEPGEKFVYEFTPKDPGTYWFHPHVRGAEQLERGLYGILIVEDAEPAPYDRDLVWVLDDWLLMEDAQIYDEFVTGADISHDGRWGNIPTINGAVRPTFEANPGERIRLRLVNSANARVFRPNLSALEPRGLAFDGMTASQPFDPRGYVLAPGNRLDLDITVPRRLRGETVPFFDQFMPEPFVLAEIKVADVEPVNNEPFPIPAAAHLPAWDDALKLPVAMELRLNIRRGGKHGVEWTMNQVAWPEREELRLEQGRLHRIRVVNESFRLHPMHIHGQFFRLIARDGVRVEEPHWRDTVLVWPEETIDVAMVPLDRGMWMTHCHIQEHAEAGMMTLLEIH